MEHKYVVDDNDFTTCRLELMEQCLHWRHLAPTAPDTLASYPFDAFDPFIIQSTPHVLFTGNQPEFGRRTATGGCCSMRVLVCK